MVIFSFIDRMLHLRGPDTVRISKVKGHADEGMVLDGRVREDDRFGNEAADEAADFGRRRVGDAVIDARRNLSGVCGRWYPVILDRHRFFIAISRAVVNYDGGSGTAPDPLVWSAGALSKRRRLVHAVRDHAFLPGPPGIWDSEWVNIPAAAICADDVAHWPKTHGLVVKWVTFLESLHWPAGRLDLGVGGISYVELLILYELWAGERLSLGKGYSSLPSVRVRSGDLTIIILLEYCNHSTTTTTVLASFIVLLPMFIVVSVISFMRLLFIVGMRPLGVGGIGFGRILLFIRIGGFAQICFPPAPFLQCEPHLSPGGSGVLSDPARIDAEFRKAWLPYFCRSWQREASRKEFDREVEGWLPLLPEVSLLRLTGQMLADVVLHKGVSAGSLDGWEWRELKVFPVSWYDWSCSHSFFS